jgi:hypothetical protein
MGGATLAFYGRVTAMITSCSRTESGLNRRFPAARAHNPTNTEPQNVEVNPVPSRLSLSFLHDSDLIIRQSAVLFFSACNL